MKIITTQEVTIEITGQDIRDMITQDRLMSSKLGKDYTIQYHDMEDYSWYDSPGDTLVVCRAVSERREITS